MFNNEKRKFQFWKHQNNTIMDLMFKIERESGKFFQELNYYWHQELEDILSNESLFKKRSKNIKMLEDKLEELINQKYEKRYERKYL
jgi:hypothetical protein